MASKAIALYNFLLFSKSLKFTNLHTLQTLCTFTVRMVNLSTKCKYSHFIRYHVLLIVQDGFHLIQTSNK